MSTKIDLTPEQAAAVQQLMTDEITAEGCDPKEHGPRHFSGFLAQNGNHFINNGCESHGRHLDPVTLTFKGNSHCSCDTCF